MLPVVVTSSKEQQVAASSENYTLSRDIYSTNNEQQLLLPARETWGNMEEHWTTNKFEKRGTSTERAD